MTARSNGASQLDTEHPRPCPGCNYDLRGLALPCCCPECGRRVTDADELRPRPRVHWGVVVVYAVLGACIGPVGLVAAVTIGGVGPLLVAIIPFVAGIVIGGRTRSLRLSATYAGVCGLGACTPLAAWAVRAFMSRDPMGQLAGGILLAGGIFGGLLTMFLVFIGAALAAVQSRR